jgi:hypothetical protein
MLKTYARQVTLSLFFVSCLLALPLVISETQNQVEGEFDIVTVACTVPFYIDRSTDPLVKWAVNQLLDDIQTITGKRPTLVEVSKQSGKGVVIGQLSDPMLITSKLITAQLHEQLAGKWEHFSLTKQQQNLLLVGSDVRGTVYAVFELAERLGISPWLWWADVHPNPQAQLSVRLNQSDSTQGPSVQYRGIFLNDEDWGLRPWAAHTFEPEAANIGPKTYEKIFQLLLRLKANTLWPAMHPGTNGFFTVAGNSLMAAKYHIVIGSSHAEPMLRNNVAEWDHVKQGDFNYFSNKKQVDAYWQQRISEIKASDTQTLITLGMRGVHDSGMQGATSNAQAIAKLQDIIANQRRMLATTLHKSITDIPQVFIPYKEVLPLYDGGLMLPDDVTLMWTDDNYGYIRRLSEPSEQQRSGGSGVYYHLSYWGRPHDYLWLSTTQPGLIWYEMSKAYANGANKIWIANVGDIKPAEYNMELFLDLAWNIDAIGAQDLDQYLQQWAEREFNAAVAPQLKEIFSEFYRLAALRKPEFMGWSQTEPTTKTVISGFSDVEAKRRLGHYATLLMQVDALKALIPKWRQDAWFELVEYPIKSAALINEKFLSYQLFAHSQNASERDNYHKRSSQALHNITSLTEYYNQGLAQGKWQHIMSMAPRSLPVFSEADAPLEPSFQAPEITSTQRIYLQATDHVAQFAPAPYYWKAIQQLGYSNSAVSLLPLKNTAFATEQPWLEYEFSPTTFGDYSLELRFLPTHANHFDHQIEVLLDGKTLGNAMLNTQGRSEQWKINVLRNSQIIRLPMNKLTAGSHRLRIYFMQSGIVLDQLAVYPQSLNSNYEIPYID